MQYMQYTAGLNIECKISRKRLILRAIFNPLETTLVCGWGVEIDTSLGM